MSWSATHPCPFVVCHRVQGGVQLREVVALDEAPHPHHGLLSCQDVLVPHKLRSTDGDRRGESSLSSDGREAHAMDCSAVCASSCRTNCSHQTGAREWQQQSVLGTRTQKQELLGCQHVLVSHKHQSSDGGEGMATSVSRNAVLWPQSPTHLHMLGPARHVEEVEVL